MAMSVSRDFGNPFFIHFKKHYCPTCSREMIVVKVERVVNSKSQEAGNFDFRFGCGSHPGKMFGNVRFIWNEFKCPCCGLQISIEAMRNKEKNEKNKQLRPY